MHARGSTTSLTQNFNSPTHAASKKSSMFLDNIAAVAQKRFTSTTQKQVSSKNLDLGSGGSFFLTDVIAQATTAAGTTSRNTAMNKTAKPSMGSPSKRLLNSSLASLSSNQLTYEERVNLQKQKLLEAQEKQKYIMMLKFAEQKERINLKTGLEKKMKNADKIIAKMKKEQEEKLTKIMEKKYETIKKIQSDKRQENREAM